MVQTVGLDAFSEFHRASVVAVGVPLMLFAGFATHMNSRASIARQSVEAAASPQTAMMNKLALYVFPLGVVVGGPFLPLAVIMYWLANNIWTYGQQHYVFGKIEKEEEAKKEEAIARRAANAPAPGAKPKRKKQASPNGSGPAASPEITTSTGVEAADEPTTKPPPRRPNNSGTVGQKPRPGARPKKRKP